MAGITNAERAGRAAYAASADPSPEKDWKDLTAEERDKWIAAGAAPPEDEEPDGPTLTQGEIDEFRRLREDNERLTKENADLVAKALQPEPVISEPRGNAAAAATYEHVGETMPSTDPEHGDLTPGFAYWYAGAHTKEQFMEKYGSRLAVVPEGAIRRAEDLHERRNK